MMTIVTAKELKDFFKLSDSTIYKLAAKGELSELESETLGDLVLRGLSALDFDNVKVTHLRGL